MTTKLYSHRLRSSLLLTLTALIWGLAFVAQRVGMQYIGPFLFAGLRFWLGALTLLVFLLLSGGWYRFRQQRRTDLSRQQLTTDRINPAWTDLSLDPASSRVSSQIWHNSRLLKGAIIAGTCLFLGASLQQIGLVHTGAGKAGFLTAFYIVLVPILGILIRRKTHWNSWLGVALALVGLYFLSVTEQLTIQAGDLILIIGALFWASHIQIIDHYVNDLGFREVLGFCVAQFMMAGTLCLIAFPLVDRYFVANLLDWSALADALPAIIYTGILSTGVAFTLQAIGQQGLPPTAASIIMSLESLFSVLGGIVILQEALSLRELIGCVLMFGAVLLAQLPVGNKPQEPPDLRLQ